MIREIEPAKLYGVGVNLTIDAAAKSSAAASPKDSSTASRIVVSEIHPSGPASKCLKPGDIVLAVNDTPVDVKATPQDVAKLVRGPEGSEVSVLVERNGKKLEFKLTRERIGQRSNDGDGKAGAAMENKHQEELRLSECVEDVSKGIGKLSVENLPVEYKKTQVHLVQNAPAATSTHSKDLSQVQDLTSSHESSDKFTEQHLSPLPSLPTRKSFETHSEEKSHDELDNCSAINSVDGEHWELLSAASGSAVVISFSGSISGSLRSASPSMLSNKFILSETTGDEYIEHVVLPTDTLQGICLAYKLSATRLRMINGFSGNSLQMAPKKLRIPTPTKSPGIMIRTQGELSDSLARHAAPLCTHHHHYHSPLLKINHPRSTSFMHSVLNCPLWS